MFVKSQCLSSRNENNWKIKAQALKKRKKSVSTTIFITVLLVTSIAIQNIESTVLAQNDNSNSNLVTNGTIIANFAIHSPHNITYNEKTIPFLLTIQSSIPPLEFFRGSLFDSFLRYGCALDYDTKELINLVENTNLYDQFPNNVAVTLSNIGNNTYEGNATLTNLSLGSHNITVWIRVEQDYLSYSIPVGSSFTTVSFNIDSAPPNILILSPQTEIYNQSSVPLNISINKTPEGIQYSLDGQQNVTITGNTTLTGLSDGLHSIVVYANDTYGNMGASETQTFTVQEPFPTATVTAVCITLAVVIGAGLMVYFRMRRH